jgi:NAD(P)-dependent dehydrogenase (short-subunit alcohol dehydrogenase family)
VAADRIAVGSAGVAITNAAAETLARSLALELAPARRIGTPEDIAQGVLFALTNTFLTGQTLHIDGGEPLT